MSLKDIRKVLGDNSSFTELTPGEKQILRQALLLEMDRRKKDNKLEQLREIIPIQDWLESEYYLGPNYVKIYDYWKDLIREIYDRDPKKDPTVNEVIISGSLGAGKSTAAIIILLRKFYELSCYKNIYQMFGLMSTTSIVFVYFSLNKYQANLTGFGDMRSFLDSIPYFRDSFPRDQKIDSLILLPENIMVTYGSGSQHSIGMSMLGSVLDEANFFKGETGVVTGGSNVTTSKVSELYTSIINRSKSRFVVEGGIDYSLSILVSSTTHSSSFTEQRMRLAENDPHAIVRCPTLWEAKPKNYSGERFWVFKGTSNLEPFVVEGTDDISRYRVSEGMRRVEETYEDEESFDAISAEIEKIPESMKENFLAVPIELKKGFETNIIKSLQDIAGVSVAPIGRLFTSMEIYKRSCKDIEHPFVSQVITISTGDRIKINDYLKRDFVFRDKHKPRYLHIDQSATTDSTGITSVYVKDIIEEDNVRKPIIAVDFMLRIEPPRPPKRIAIYKIRDFVVYLNKVCGLPIGRVSYDIWSSEESRQILGEMGYKVAYLSVDKTDKAYIDLVVLLYEGRLEIYDYPYFRKELFNLIHDRVKRKVDHPRYNDDNTPGCFLGDTKIKLLDGTNIRIDELVGRESIELYGCRPDSEIIPVVAKKVFKTKEVDKYIRLVLNSGEEVRCTLDHRFMLRDGSYKEAQYLSEEDSLMTLYSNYKKGIKSKEIIYYDKPISVYDIEVPKTSNFALTAGVFVHNSKDVADSLAGACQGVLTSSFLDATYYNDVEKIIAINSDLYAYDAVEEIGVIKKDKTIEELIDREIESELNQLIWEYDLF